MKQSDRIGIMGGTFNPIHIGHLVTAEEARVQFSLDKVIFMPSGEPPHKKDDDQIIAANERFLMTVIATASNPDFRVSRLEVDREGPTHTIDTVRELKRIYGETELYFITGADAVWEILTWKEPEKLASYCKFIAATRPGHSLKKFEELRLRTIKESPGKDMPEVKMMEIPALAISSTDIRDRVRRGEPIRYLVPEGILSYIYKSRFYSN